ncbi:hypothetical protein [Nocardia amamiensis]|uniref:hypothetical protein n=1 Tax=Nocardia amamiensis TaxID=404578 RepID=UPI000835EBDA|nr:hypothetical protein [Nocardia amamiensis]
MLSLLSGLVHSGTAIWLETIAIPLILALSGVWYERSRRRTYRMVLTESTGDTMLLDMRRGGRTLLLVRSADGVELTAVLRHLPTSWNKQ